MSVEAVKWAMDDAPMLLTEKGKPDTTARHVLQVLAEHAHTNGGGARPSIRRIQYRSGYDRRTVQRALRRLEDGSLIAPTGMGNGCTVYQLALQLKRPASDWTELEAEEERQREADAERQRRSRAKRVTHSDSVTVTDSASVTDAAVTESASVSHALSVRESRTLRPDVTDGTPPKPSVEPPREPSLFAAPPKAERETPRAAAQMPVPDGFEAFWAEYPRKAAKADAKKAYAAAIKAGIDSELLVTAAIKHREHWTAEGRQSSYVPYPATWLRKGSYEDELQLSAKPADTLWTEKDYHDDYFG